MILKKTKFKCGLIMMLMAGGFALPLTSCSFIAPKVIISGEGGGIVPAHSYVYSLSWTGIYNSNILVNGFVVNYYADDNGVVDFGQDVTNDWQGDGKVFKTFEDSENTQELVSNHDHPHIMIQTYQDLPSELPSSQCWMVIKYCNNDAILGQSQQLMSNNMQFISMDVNANSKPQDYGTEQLADGSYDAWSVLTNNYIFASPTFNDLVKVRQRLESDIVYETFDAINNIKKTNSNWNLKVSGFNLHFEMIYDATNGQIDDLHLQLDADISIQIIFTFNTTVHLSVDTEGTYLINGAYTQQLRPSHYLPDNTGQYLSIIPGGVSHDDGLPTRFHFHFSSDKYKANLPDVDKYRYWLDSEPLGTSFDYPSFNIKSYYLDKLSNIEPIQIEGWNFDGEHLEIPTLYQNPPNVDYNNVDTWWIHLCWYESTDFVGPPADKDKQCIYDYERFMRTALNLPYVVTCENSAHTTTRQIPFQQLLSNFNATNHMNNETVTDWNGKNYLNLCLNSCYVATGTPYQVPDANNNTTILSPYNYAFPPSIDINFIQQQVV